ncbi:MAG: CTP synthase [Clostridiales Family XIII bacterium]|jgi:CTP synthase|nr:CTP synthase [Clostridiales Family XIII bacterium]
MAKYVFVTGGVISGLGKGITASALGRLLKDCGLKVTAQKLDPYINVDPGTMNPIEHGEVFVTEDGAETDLDLGHYERFIDEDLNKYSNLTSGKVYWNVLQKERKGEYLGQTVQVIPHITDEIKNFIYTAAKTGGADIVITEIGGTTGDIESLPFLEAARQIHSEVGISNCIFIHVTLVPYLYASHEYKSKPTQHSVKELQSLGIFPDIIVTRSEGHVGDDIKRKISLFCNVRQDSVIESVNIPLLYEAPLMFERQKFCEIVLDQLCIEAGPPEMSDWEAMLDRVAKRDKQIAIGLVGKYTKLHDAYYSVAQALHHAGYEIGAEVEIKWIESEAVTRQNAADMLAGVDGVLVPGGFGERGITGMVEACRHARENNVPYLGICLGMQVGVIEFARNRLGLAAANSTEFDPASSHPLIHLMPDQHGNIPKGGTMRLGAYPCAIKPGSRMRAAYGKDEIAERHRHRYEFNNEYRDSIEKMGMHIVGQSPDGRLVEAVEIPENDFFVGVQYHPEFKSRPNRAHPLFREFTRAAMGRKYGGAK